MGTFRQFGLLLWKNYTLHKRRPWSTVLEMVLPILFTLILVAIRQTDLDSDTVQCKDPYAKDCSWPAFRPSEALVDGSCQPGLGISYTPRAAAGIIARSNSSIPFLSAPIGFDTESDLVSYIMGLPGNGSCNVGVVFTNWVGPDFEYKLRFSASPGGESTSTDLQTWRTGSAFPFFAPAGPRGLDYFGDEPHYGGNGFLALQHGINLAIANLTGASQAATALEQLQVRRFPYPPYNDDPFVNAVKFGMPMLLMLSFLFPIINIVRSVVHEKERRLKESMKMMGLRNWVHWMAWFTDFFIFLTVAVVAITILLRAGKVLQYSDMVLIFVYLMLFAIASISFGFLVSVFFDRASTAAAAGGILWFCNYIPYTFIAPRYDTLSGGSKQGLCFLSTTCMCMGSNIIATLEASGDGVTWSNMNTPPSVDDNFSFGQVLGMLVFDAVFYALLTWYIEAVFPGAYGVPRPWYFPFTSSYWCSSSSGARVDAATPLLQAEEEDEDKVQVDPRSFEREPEGLRAGISVRGLRKVFDAKVAVNRMWLNMYEGQVTALLGHNGAGKTTTMSILTGLFPPTEGTALVGGHDIRTSIGEVQRTLGICPQHDVLFDPLTVAEHLWFFCRLKGVPASEVAGHVDSMVADLELLDKRNAQSSTLSGGMKRKLSTGMALVGGSKIVILDEPTSGMDPSARRATWDLISKHRSGRTILLSTHFMDEADLLGDRVAIMSDGIVRCAGSSLFLKGRYGVGYHLTMVKQREAGTQHDLCDRAAVNQLITRHVPDAQMTGNVGAELTYVLPKESSASFPALFTALERERAALGIESYGASVTTMEEVFLRVGEHGTDAQDTINIQERIERQQEEHKGRLQMDGAEDDSLLGGNSRNTGMRLWRQQFYAMLVKHCLHSIRNKYAIVSQLVLPWIFTLIALTVTKTLPGVQDSASRGLIDLAANYKTNDVPYQIQDPTIRAALPPYLQEFGPAQTWSEATQPMFSALLLKAGTRMQDVAYFHKHTAIALTAAANETVAWFNNQAYHSSAESVATMTNVLLRPAGISITTYNHPLPLTLLERAQAQAQQFGGFNIAFSILFGMSFLSSSFVLFLVAERANKAKHIQFVSGVTPFSYWASSYLWDFLNFMLPVLGIMILFVCFGVDEYSGERLGYVFLLFLFFGLAIIPLMYLASFLFMNTSIAYSRLTMFNVATGLAGLLTVAIFDIINPSTADKLKAAFLFLPNFAFGQGLSDIYSNYDHQVTAPQQCARVAPFLSLTVQQCCDLLTSLPSIPTDLSCQTNYLAWPQPGIGRYLLVMGLESAVFFILVLLIDTRFFTRSISVFLSWFRSAPELGRREDLEDEDVARERARVNALQVSSGGEDVLVVRDLSKIYSTGTGGCGPSKLAVDRVSVGVPRGECFGLLGVNGAGKTTTFGMLTGDLTVTSGDAFVEGFSILTHMQQVRQQLGYCPQFDGLIDLMTGREVLVMYARLRGVPEHTLATVVNNLIESLMLEKHADKYTKSYSGGNKRKLSTAVAMIGDPAIVFLDEPTTGMDPGARRFLWNRINAATNDGRCIVLTSHSMEECEALCTRLAIMVNGRFQCVGSPQHLKTRFGRGYALTARLPGGAAADTAGLKRFLGQHVPDLRVKEEHQGYVKFVAGPSVGLARLFALLEEAKTTLHLEDYSVSQTTLEQVFLDFARHQVEDSRAGQQS